MSAPTPTTFDYDPEWYHNCSPPNNVREMSDSDLASRITLQCRIARSNTTMLQNNYIKAIYNVTTDQHHVNAKNNHLHWLPTAEEVHKELGDLANQTIIFDEMLKRTFHYLQKAAVGLEQAVRDQEREDDFLASSGAMRPQFESAYSKFMTLIRAIKGALAIKGICVENVERSIMSDEFRSMTIPDRHMRDYIILRESIRAMDYTLAVFELFTQS